MRKTHVASDQMNTSCMQRLKKKIKKQKGLSTGHATHACAPASKEHAVPKEMLYKKSLRERCANGSCPGARRGLWLEGLEAAEGYFRKIQEVGGPEEKSESQYRLKEG